jgi:two-component system cell cycle response regulator DivK
MKPNILVIEDNEQNLYLLTFILEKNGFVVTAARDGREGIEKACGETPALILLDIQLPLMDGYEVARRLRRIDAVKEIPIIAVTSYAMVGDREKSIAAGCTGYMEKPINPVTFMDEIKKFLPVRGAVQGGVK